MTDYGVCYSFNAYNPKEPTPGLTTQKTGNWNDLTVVHVTGQHIKIAENSDAIDWNNVRNMSPLTGDNLKIDVWNEVSHKENKIWKKAKSEKKNISLFHILDLILD